MDSMVSRYLRHLCGLAPLAGTLFFAPVPAGAELPVLSEGGEFRPFHRYQPVLGRWLSGGVWLESLPESYRFVDFPHTPRPFEKEVPYADALSVVRILGGWNYENTVGGELLGSKEADLVYRLSNGSLAYRWHLLAPRLQPYLDQGYREFTIVLDNVPWALARDGGLITASYGQGNPPEDLDEWREFIRRFALELVEILPPESLPVLRFRLGTEMQNSNRFNADYTEYHAFYRATWEGLTAALGPDVNLGPYNQAGTTISETRPDHIDLLQHIKDSGDLPLPGFLSHSLYFIPQINDNGIFRNTDPYERVPQYREFWDLQNAMMPGVAEIPRELHEFGVLRSEHGLDTNEPGARGAAQIGIATALLLRGGLSGIWHWQLVEPISIGQRQALFPYGLAWLMHLYDAMVGGTAFYLEWPEPDADGVRKAGLGSRHDDVLLCKVATFHVDREQEFPAGNSVRVRIPKTWLSSPGSERVRYIELNSDNAVYDIAYDWLREENLLQPGYEDSQGRIPARIRDMGIWDARPFLLDRRDILMRAFRESLTFREYQGQIRDVGDYWEFEWNQPVPAVGMLVIDRVSDVTHVSTWEARRNPQAALQPDQAIKQLMVDANSPFVVGSTDFNQIAFRFNEPPVPVHWRVMHSADLANWQVQQEGMSLDFIPGSGTQTFIFDTGIAAANRSFFRAEFRRPGSMMSDFLQR